MSFVIVGLGNPGQEYEKTRHNAGRMIVAQFGEQNDFAFAFNKKAHALVADGLSAGRHGKIGKEKVTLILPETMMNNSGKAIMAFIKSAKAAQNLLVVHDDLDLPLGVIKLVINRGSGGHKGVESINRAIKTEAYARLRIGISGQGKKNQAKKIEGEEKVIKHVIGKFSPKEEAAMKKVIKKSVNVLELFITEGSERAQQEANTR